MNDKPSATPDLRERAERKWAEQPTSGEKPPVETMQRLVQELQIHQLELEMQNEELRQAHLELSESRDRYADLYDFAPVAYLTLDQHGNISAANLTAATMLGIDKVALLNANITRFIDSGSQDIMYFHLQQIYAGNSNHHKESCTVVIAKPNGEKLTVHVESLCYGSEDSAHCRTVFVDITQQTIQSDALQASEQRYQRISNAVSDYIYHVPFNNGRTGKLTPDTNSWEITGYTSDEIAAMDDPTRIIVHPEDWPETERHREQLVAGADTSTTELRIITKKGKIRWVSNTLSALRDPRGKLIGYDGILKDITARKTAQLTLEALNAELGSSLDSRTSQLQETINTVKLMATAMANLHEGVVIVRCGENPDDNRTVYANKAITLLSGYNAGELIGKSLVTLQAEGIVPDNIAVPEHAAVASESGRYSQVASLRLHTGYYENYRDVEILTSPITDALNQISHLVLIYRDVTERKKTELELYQRNEHIKAILETVADAILTIDTQGNISDINPVASSLFGYTPQELQGSHLTRLFPGIFINGHNLNPATALIGPTISGHSSAAAKYQEYTAQHKNGSGIAVGLAIREIDHRDTFTCVIRDLSMIKLMQRQMVDIAEEENRRIGRELHDSIQQQLVGTRLLADNLSTDVQGVPPAALQTQTRLTQALDQIIDNLRTLCRGMVAIQLDSDDLQAALYQLATGVTETSNIDCSFTSSIQLKLQDSSAAKHIYRIAQEAVTNALKHARAAQIAISLSIGMGQLILKVCDDGIGIRDEDFEKGGLGLQIMRYRAGLVNGNLRIDHPETGGTCLIFSVPALPQP